MRRSGGEVYSFTTDPAHPGDRATPAVASPPSRRCGFGAGRAVVAAATARPLFMSSPRKVAGDAGGGRWMPARFIRAVLGVMPAPLRAALGAVCYRPGRPVADRTGTLMGPLGSGRADCKGRPRSPSGPQLANMPASRGCDDWGDALDAARRLTRARLSGRR